MKRISKNNFGNIFLFTFTYIRISMKNHDFERNARFFTILLVIYIYMTPKNTYSFFFYFVISIAFPNTNTFYISLVALCALSDAGIVQAQPSTQFIYDFHQCCTFWTYCQLHHVFSLLPYTITICQAMHMYHHIINNVIIHYHLTLYTLQKSCITFRMTYRIRFLQAHPYFCHMHFLYCLRILHIQHIYIKTWILDIPDFGRKYDLPPTLRVQKMKTRKNDGKTNIQHLFLAYELHYWKGTTENNMIYMHAHPCYDI